VSVQELFDDFQQQLDDFQQQQQQRFQQLQQQQQQQQLARQLAQMEATNTDTRILSSNRRSAGYPLRPLLKYVSFSFRHVAHLRNSHLISID